MTDKLQCQFCPRFYDKVQRHLLEAAARTAGWMVGEATSLSGKHIRRVVCPVCLGRTSGADEPLPSWDARCRTCDSSASEEWADDETAPVHISEKDARNWALDHECEPWVDLIKPEAVTGETARVGRFSAAGAA